jgi:hypothetical protein
MKKIILSIVFLAISTVVANATPGTANSFLEINTYHTPIVTNAEEAIYAYTMPTASDIISPVETNEVQEGYMVCYPKRMNVITNSVESLLKCIDGLVVTFKQNYRTVEIYFGTEYTNLIEKSESKSIQLKPDGILFNGSTNAISITNAPALIKMTSFLDSNIWVVVEYPTF